MKHSTFSYPRYNFAQVFGLMWLSPIIFAFLESYLVIHLIATILFFPVVLGFYYLKYFTKYLAGFYLLALIIIIIYGLISPIQTLGTPDYSNQLTRFGQLLILLSLFLFKFHICTEIEFQRKDNSLTNYATEFSKISSKTIFLINSYHPSYLFALITLALICFYTDEIRFIEFDVFTTRNTFLYLYLITSIVCFFSLLFKQKWGLHILVFLTSVYLFDILLTQYLNSENLSLSFSILFTFSYLPFFLCIILLIYHPIIDYYFDKPNETNQDYDKILDLE